MAQNPQTPLDRKVLPDDLTTNPDWQKNYPAFVLPSLLRLTSGVDAPGSPEESLDASRVASTLRDPMTLCDLLGTEADLTANFYPAKLAPTPDTSSTIDTFLATYGSQNEHETDILTKVIFNPTPDYAAALAAEERRSVPQGRELDPEEVGEHDAAVNRYIARSRAQGRTVLPEAAPDSRVDAPASRVDAPASRVDAPGCIPTFNASPEEQNAAKTPEATSAAKTPDSGQLSESFARVMIKNRNYSKALEIISDLNLNNPEKSVYFADQIRFLKKLIALESRNQR